MNFELRNDKEISLNKLKMKEKEGYFWNDKIINIKYLVLKIVSLVRNYNGIKRSNMSPSPPLLFPLPLPSPPLLQYCDHPWCNGKCKKYGGNSFLIALTVGFKSVHVIKFNEITSTELIKRASFLSKCTEFALSLTCNSLNKVPCM